MNECNDLNEPVDTRSAPADCFASGSSTTR